MFESICNLLSRECDTSDIEVGSGCLTQPRCLLSLGASSDAKFLLQSPALQPTHSHNHKPSVLANLQIPITTHLSSLLRYNKTPLRRPPSLRIYERSSPQRLPFHYSLRSQQVLPKSRQTQTHHGGYDRPTPTERTSERSCRQPEPRCEERRAIEDPRSLYARCQTSLSAELCLNIIARHGLAQFEGCIQRGRRRLRRYFVPRASRRHLKQETQQRQGNCKAARRPDTKGSFHPTMKS
jgi:hypothetical protein